MGMDIEVTYTPDGSFTGSDSFAYTLTARGATTEPGTVTIVVK